MEGNDGSVVRIGTHTGDEELRLRLEKSLERWARSTCVRYTVTAWDGAEEGTMDILFWDGQGEKTPSQCAVAERAQALILLSDSESLAIRMYKLHPVGFLPKAFTQQALDNVMDQCFSAWKGGLMWLELPYKRDQVRLPLCQLRFVEADGRECLLHCSGGQLRAGVTMGKLCESLPSPPFFRCQKGFVVHLDAVEKLMGGELILKGERRAISVSRRQWGVLQSMLREWAEQGGVRDADHLCGV